MAEQIVTITNNTRYGVTTPAPAVSILDGLPIAFGIPNPGNVTLNIQSFSQDSAISPEIFSGQLAFFANQSKEIIARDRDLALAYVRIVRKYFSDICNNFILLETYQQQQHNHAGNFSGKVDVWSFG